MVQKEEAVSANQENASDGQSKQRLTSKRVTDHLANERTFLAWIRTGLATITLGFVVERFGLLLREMGLKAHLVGSENASTLVGVTLTLLGVGILIVALVNFLQARQSIDKEAFHPSAKFAILLTVITSIVGILLAIYLLLTA